MSTPDAPLLRVMNLSVHFGQLKAVDQVSFGLSPGPIVSIIGPNGAGKTTLVNAITGLGRLTAGRVHFAGQDITGLPPHRVAALGIARTFQNIRLFRKMTVLENVLTGGQSIICHYGLADIALGTRRQAVAEARLHEAAVAALERFGLAERRHERASALSYGQRRLLELARVVVRRPRLLLLDEPAAGLTPREVEGLTRYLEALSAEGITLMMIEHNMDLVMGISHRVIVLSAGQTIADGPPQAVRTDPAVLDAYMGGAVTDA